MFTGSLVALITPFKDGSVDEKGFEKFVAWQIKEGTDGLVPCGTTGESPTLSYDEHKRVIDICIATTCLRRCSRKPCVRLQHVGWIRHALSRQCELPPAVQLSTRAQIISWRSEPSIR